MKKQELRTLWLTLTEVLSHLFAIGLVAGIQRGFSYLLNFITPKELPSLGSFLEALIALMFLVIYLSLAYETVAVFVPWMRKKNRSDDESSKSTSSSSS